MAEGFSILIPTHGRIQYLEKLAQSLQVAKEHFHFPSETIFIDDTPGSQQTQVQEIAARYHCRCLTDIHNVAAKRNKGIQEAQFDFILFIDSDCEATPDLLIEHWKSLHTSPEVGGCLGLLTFIGSEHWLWDVVRLTPFTVSFYWPLSRACVPWGPTANISYRRDVLMQVGGCDETFPSQPGGEDVDMGLRITKAGFHIVTNARAEVFHPNETWLGLRTALKRFYAWGRADHYLTVRHPDMVLLQFPRVILLTTMITLLCCALAIYWFSLWILILPFA